jgi:hypothetical protein
MAAAIELDREPRLVAIEVHDEVSDRMLSPELEAQQAAAEVSPEQSFRIGLALPQRPREVDL